VNVLSICVTDVVMYPHLNIHYSDTCSHPSDEECKWAVRVGTLVNFHSRLTRALSSTSRNSPKGGVIRALQQNLISTHVK
jgi:hypothetical protein